VVVSRGARPGSNLALPEGVATTSVESTIRGASPGPHRTEVFIQVTDTYLAGPAGSPRDDLRDIASMTNNRKNLLDEENR